MVSKVAVIALVAIVACPILLGYAMNLQEVTETDYKVSGESVNVTPLLQNGTGYTYVHSDTYSLNTNVKTINTSYNTETKILPDYQLITTQKSSFAVTKFNMTSTTPYYTGRLGLSTMPYMYWQFDHPGNTGQINFQLIYTDETPYSIEYQRVHSVYYNNAENKLYVSYYNTLAHGWLTNVTFNIDPDLKNQLTFKFSGSVTAGSGILERARYTYEMDNFVDFSQGFKLTGFTFTPTTNRTIIDLPENPRNVLLTVDLDSVTASSFTFETGIYINSSNTWEPVTLEKTTDGDGVHWKLYKSQYHTFVSDLYYDPNISNNTYQIYMDITHCELRYVGNWPTIIGEANYYQMYQFDWQHNNITDIGDVYFKTDTPRIRVDDSEYRGFEYPIITNKTYTPADFKTNPSTTVKSTIYGDSLTFGGNTYAVSNGKITLGSRQIPVSDLTFSSVPVVGGYENRIGNTPVSVTASPSTITFNGDWSASISTVGMESYTQTKTEWTPGQFGWNGLDQNFLIVGLITSIGVFIALGIVMRRTKAALWPALIVCGGAAVLFFVML